MNKFWHTDDHLNDKEKDRFKLNYAQNNVINEEQEYNERSSDSDARSRSRRKANTSNNRDETQEDKY